MGDAGGEPSGGDADGRGGDPGRQLVTLPLGPADEELVEAARAAISAAYRRGWHHVGAALRTRSGRIVTGVHLEANVGRIAVCAEAVALGRAITEGEWEFTTVVAVIHPRPDAADRTIRVVSPCGMCRELLADYAPDIEVIYPGADGPTKSPIAELLPFKYARP